MGLYSIKELEQLSGIKAHTLRIWEKRYNLISPERTDTNIRVYNDNDLKKLLNVTMLYQAGYKISKIAQLEEFELNREIENLTTSELNEIGKIENLIKSMIDLDEALFEKTINTCVLQFGFEKTVIQIVYPFLNKIGVFWLNNQIVPAQEHFITNLIRQKMIVAIDGLVSRPKSDQSTFILFLPEDEMHELPLQFYHYLIKKAGHQCFYLGAHVPNSDIIDICNDSRLQNPIAVSVLTVSTSEKKSKKYFSSILKKTKKVPLWLAGNIPDYLLTYNNKVHRIVSLEQLKDLIQ